MKNKNHGDDARERALSRAFRDSILDASEDEFAEELGRTGEDLQALAKRGRAVIDHALSQHPGSEESHPQKDEELAVVQDLHRGLGSCIQLLRRKKRLSHEELADKARITVDEVRHIELDPSFSPRPRTIAQLEDFFQLKRRSLGLLSGSVRTQGAGDAFREEVKRFAAQSSGMGKLSREEKRLLSEFVKLLADYTD